MSNFPCDDNPIIEAIARDLAIKAGLDPDKRTYGPNSIVGVAQDGWPAWEYFWEEAARMWQASDTKAIIDD